MTRSGNPFPPRSGSCCGCLFRTALYLALAAAVGSVAISVGENNKAQIVEAYETYVSPEVRGGKFEKVPLLLCS